MSEKYIVGIGACNADIYGKSEIKIKEHYDHPALIKTSAGGVTRNVLDNACRLGLNCKLLTAIGDDSFGEMVLNQSKKVGIDVNDVLKVKGERTGVFMQVQDKNNDMHLALCDMSINKYIDITYLKSKRDLLKNASAIVLDPSLAKETLDFVFDTYDDIPIFVDPVSDHYAKKIRPYLSKIYLIKPNKTEFEVLANMPIGNDDDYLKAFKKLKKNGTIFYVSLGSKGGIYVDGDLKISRKFKEVKHMANASGAGDACMAALLYGFINGSSIDDTIDLALAAGIAAIRCSDTINPELKVSLLRKIIKENRK